MSERSASPVPDNGDGSIAHELTQIWAEVLKIPAQSIGPDQNFFSLGGDSLLVTRVLDQINRRFFADRSEDDVPIAALFTHGTIRSLAAYLDKGPAASSSQASASSVEESGCVAIIGMSCRFPGAADIETFWRNLRDGVESIKPFTEHELRSAGVSPASLRRPDYVRSGALIDGVDLFDASYFCLTPREAALTSPEQRLLLECSEEALQDAGYGVRGADERTGVFVGTGLSTYLLERLPSGIDGLATSEGMALIASNTCAAARISYLLDLSGPSITLDTACSSSLVAVHAACRALLAGECDLALAGGATVRQFAPAGYRAEEGGIFSPDGHCRPFDRRAQGTVGSSGAAMVLLKRLSVALTDRDSIHAIVRGAAINNDGGAKVGFTAPGVTGQVNVIRSALANARVAPSDIQYLETHGTATALGDQIEFAALKEVFPSSRPNDERCTLGTLKANIGHTEAAAGIAGLIKVALALKHRAKPPAIHFQEASEALDLQRSAFTLNTALQGWPGSGVPRRAGVSSFGIGGTNAHAVLEEAIPARCGAGHRSCHVVPVSALSEAALHESCRRLAKRFRSAAPADLGDMAHTLQVGRKSHRFRHCVVASDAAEAAQALDSWVAGTSAAVSAVDAVPVVFLFPGQGSQYPRMLAGLYDREPVFREHFDRCAHLLRPELGADLQEISRSAADMLAQTRWCQPALFSVEYSLAQMWLAWGITPSLMIGHSLGEYVAACVSGVFTLSDALSLIAARGRLMQRSPAGKMLAMRVGRERVAEMLDAECALAAINGPENCVVSGPAEAINRLKARLASMNVAATELNTSHAFHSALMDGMLEDFGRVLGEVEWGKARLPFISNLTGQRVSAEEVSAPEYWLAHTRRTVDFAGGLATALQGSRKAFLEVGPGRVLSNCVRSMPGSRDHLIVTSARRAQDDASDESVLMHAVASLWQHGAAVDWRGFNAHSRLRRVSLPTYPFERQCHWVERTPPHHEVPVATVAERRGLDEWFHIPVWVPAQRNCGDEGAHPVDRPTCAIVIEPWPDLERVLGERFAKRGIQLVPVRFGVQFCCEGDRYTLDRNDEVGFGQLFASLDERGFAIHTVIHASEASGTSFSSCEPDEDRLGRGIYGVLSLCRALVDERTRNVSLTLLTRAAHAIVPGEPVDPAGTMMAAVAGVIANECPSIACRCIDLPVREDAEQSVAWPAALVEEILTPVEEQVVALRGPERWVRQFERASPRARAPNDSLLRPHGVYLVTGGLGGMGWTLAEFLGRTRQAKLILVARSAFPERSEWARFKRSSSADDAVCRRIQEIESLERAGAEVQVLRGDVSCKEDMRRILECAHASYGRIHGVIHAAGVPGGGALFHKQRDAVARVFAPKVMGTWFLHEACREHDLDFFVCCSSIAAVLAPAGQYDYCAANAYQDAFCHANDGQGRTRFISINWDGWREVGMAVNTEVPAHLRESRRQDLELGISCAEGMRLFEAVLSDPRPQWIISTRGLDQVQQSGARRSPTAPAVSTAKPRGSASEDVVAQIWRELLGVEARGTNDDFFELGGDSLLAIQLRTRLESHCSRPLSLKELVSRPTLGEMARFLQENS